MTIEILTPASREEWLALRRTTIGASEVACLLGAELPKWYPSAYKLHFVKSGAFPADVVENAMMRRGKLLEPVAISCLSEERPTWSITSNAIPGGRHWRDAEAGISCTPDAFAVDPDRKGFGVAQIKTVERSVFEKKWSDGVPTFIAVQAIQEALLTGASWACAVPLVVGWGFMLDIADVIDIPLHSGVIGRIKSEARAFWERVACNNPPPPDYGMDGEAIAKMWAGGGPEIDLGGDNELPGVAREWLDIGARMEADKKRREDLKGQILHKLGDAGGATFQGGRVSAMTVHRKAYTVEAGSYPRLTVRMDKNV